MPHTDAHGGERIARLALVQFVSCSGHQARAAHAQRMAERDRPAVWIDACIVIADAELPQYRKALRREGFVQFDHVDLNQPHPGPGQKFLRGRHRADAP